jgi:hypothetical protein
MYKIVKVTPNENLVVTVQFSDGFTATFNVKEFIKEGISWVNGFDFCPNFLREHL